MTFFRRAAAALLALQLGLAISSVASVARAGDDPDLERLRKRFAEGIAEEDKEHWVEALTIFREVGQVKMSPHVRFHIALGEEKTGKLKAALVGYREALVMAEKEGESAKEVAENSPKKIAALEPRVPTITVRLLGGGTAILDDEELADGDLGAPKQVETGQHVVKVRRGDEETIVRTLNLAEAARESVTIEAPVGRPADPPITVPDHPETTREEGTKLPAIVVGSAGIAAVVGAAVTFGLRQATISDVTSSCKDPENLTGCDPSKRDQASLGQTYEYASIGLAVGGVAALGAATALWFTIGQDTVVTKPQAPKPKVSAFVGPSGVVVVGTF
ncbi:MAG TPA: hypothetical protein VL400_01000 [Polyangiaceae bacterium]|nr:hypothetical protein [Polyangiaceae bacterium]